MPYDIFISYRRSDGKEKARQMKAELKDKYKVFLDFDEIEDGRFDDRILDAISDAPIFMFILTPESFDRCNEEDDWVRKEIDQALRTDSKIIPVNYDGVFTRFPDNTPQFIKDGIGQHQFSKIDSTDLYEESVAKLIKNRIAPVLEMRSAEHSRSGAEIHIETDSDCQVQRFHHELILARAGQENTVWLKKGRHKLQFVSVEDNSVSIEHIITVEDVSVSDFIEVELKSLLEQKRAEKARQEAERKAQEERKRAEKARQEAERKAQEERKRVMEAFSGHEFVDLGLPSGLLWATCNVGAKDNKPEEYGDYFAWAETGPKSSYVWSNLKYRTRGILWINVQFSKYVTDGKHGPVDGKKELEISDDAARANWGGKWRMPTVENWNELKSNCTWTWTNQGGRRGYKVTGKNGNSIFLPAAGNRDRGGLYGAGEYGFYWSSSLYADNSFNAQCCRFDSDDVNPSLWYGRYYGFSVRPVASPSIQ